MGKPAFKKRVEQRGANLGEYWPLAALILVSAAAGAAIAQGIGFSLMTWMHGFMGVFLCVFALLKLFHPDAFADGFHMYDLLAKRLRSYGYVYPLIELGLGLGYLAFWNPPVVYAATIIVMAVGAVGVILALRRGLDINCPCMGSVLDVPLSTVTLTEDLSMGLMAALMLLTYLH
jgi:hypothetical protein